MNERVAVFIDGSNFYHYLKDPQVAFPKEHWFNFKTFVDFLVRGDRQCVAKRYYTGILRNQDESERSAKLVRGQQKFLSRLENDSFLIQRGRILYDQAKPREKGTDVKIAVDLIVGAIEDSYDTAVLVSSDTDLIPALQHVVQKRGKKVEYVGFAHAPSLGIQKYVTFSYLLLPTDILRFVEADRY